MDLNEGSSTISPNITKDSGDNVSVNTVNNVANSDDYEFLSQMFPDGIVDENNESVALSLLKGSIFFILIAFMIIMSYLRFILLV